jgi:ABC-type transporter Mla maintaining outer membrane lipid asymmetry permease subunit MlaE
MKIAALFVYVLPRVLACGAVILLASALHWLTGLLAALILVPVAFGFYGQWRDAIAQAESREAPP